MFIVMFLRTRIDFKADNRLKTIIYFLLKIGKDNWRDLVMHQAKDDRELQKLLFKWLTDGRGYEADIPEAAYWARKFNFPVAELPFIVAEEVRRIESGIGDLSLEPSRNEQEEEEFWDDDPPAPRHQQTPHGGNGSAGASASCEDWGPEVLTPAPQESSEFLVLDSERITFVDDKLNFDQFMIEIKNQVLNFFNILPKCPMLILLF